MKSMLDPWSDNTPSVETDIRETFEHVWRELGEREQLQEIADADRKSLWLECNGELVEFGSVKRLGVRRSALGVEMIQFVCPRCKRRHESLRFG
jgi:hypothetical protein